VLRDSRIVSLLWPPEQPPEPGPSRLDAQTLLDDLDLREVIRALAGNDEQREPFVTQLLQEMCAREEVIQYRQEVVADLLAHEALRERLDHVLDGLTELVQDRELHFPSSWPVAQVAQRASTLEHYVMVAVLLRDALQDEPVRSAGLQALREKLRSLVADAWFQQLRQELPSLRATLDRVRSVTVGINFSPSFLPESAALLSIDSDGIEGRAPFVERLFGKGGARGLSPLYDIDVTNPHNPLYREVLRLVETAVAPVTQALRGYTQVNAFALNHLERELSFYLNAVALTRRLNDAGLPACQPRIAPLEARVARLEDAYNVTLALRLGAHKADSVPAAVSLVTNAVAFDDAPARLWILTGPNRGGKTTYIRAVGQAQVLFQAGLPVPARSGRLSPVDAIYTHFPLPEGTQVGMGRLDDEASRLAQIFQAATRQSLILLNEVLAGTSAFEAVALAIDVVRGLRLLGVRAIYTTHLHELALRADEINGTTPGDSRVGSLVAEVDAGGDGDDGAEHRRTFRIVPGPPRGSSYASDIAQRHGISFPHLVELFQRRGVLRHHTG